MNSFICKNCHKKIKTTGAIGTKNRNHCPKCLCSLHLDNKKAGDRDSNCESIMHAIGLTFKKGKINKYSKKQIGELMIIHKCSQCSKISINRLAMDDDEKKVINLLKNKIDNKDLIKLNKNNIEILNEKNKNEVLNQLYGKIIN